MLVWVFGAKGMLGEAVTDELARQNIEFKSPVFVRTRIDDIANVFSVSRAPDVVINCVGVIPEKASPRRPYEMMEVNGLLPILLANVCRQYGSQLIHISTDCVFDGKRSAPNRYSSTDRPTKSSRSEYDISKTFGEQAVRFGATVVRTSFIGYRHGLLNWAVSKYGEAVDGWENALWTGSTVWEVARRIVDVVKDREDHRLEPFAHLATTQVWSKANVLRQLSRLLELDLTVVSHPEPHINRSLAPDYTLRDLGNAEIAAELVSRWPQ